MSSLYRLPVFFNDTATTEIYTLSLHDALPISLVILVYYHAVDEALVHPGDAGGRDLVAEGGEHPVRGSLERPPAYYGADRYRGCSGGGQRLPHPRDGQDRADAHHGVGGAEDHQVGPSERLEDGVGGPGVVYAAQAQPEHLVPLATADEVLLELERAVWGVEDGRHRLVAHRQYDALDAERRREVGGDGRQHLSGAQPRGAQNVGREVPVTQLEPGVLAVAGEHLQGVERLVPYPPAGIGVCDPGQGVHDRVQVGADAQSPEVEVVGGVHDHRELPRSERFIETGGELRAADPAREGEHPHGPVPALEGETRITRRGSGRSS